ncbi:plasmid stabilization protein [Streptomyces litchfieldiae]|uniref:Plasmid stabilization protein n=1 Tax=Streptomyces litchfieldiae TaxID=3075543 RepID=A0ABU2MKF0_9ACTN|nr:plasmid stabilization protein [Streptomyces sp. DSM 44938]MDT0341848.1 plasmid stabilization protein [Streptomyces sp. DSM 44938]
MPRGASPKQERQYAHIKESAKKRGASTKRAEELAARTVNKQRATSARSARSAQGATREQLYAEARKRGIEGRSSMTKEQLAKALRR